MVVFEQRFPSFQVFTKPVGARCNLGCAYCYYTRSVVAGSQHHIMSEEVLDRYISQMMEASHSQVITFSWHGGEPMLAGIDFYRKAVALQQKYLPAGKSVINGIQTNGTLINESWCRFFAESRFLVGLSLDGPPDLHNHYRIFKNGRQSFDAVLSGFDQLVMHGIDPEILCVVNAVNQHHPLEVYDFFRHLGVADITFIPLVEPTGDQQIVSLRSANAIKFGEFLCAVFDEWKQKDIGRIRVQVFEEALRSATGQEHSLCVFRPECGAVPVVEYNGDFYSCDHYVEPEHLVGNIGISQLKNLLKSRKQTDFGRKKSDTLPDCCRHCEVLEMCNGECPKNRIIRSPENEPGLNYLCAGYRMFFNHCRPFTDAISSLKNGHTIR